MISAEVHLTVENAAPKKKQSQLHSIKLLSAKKNKLTTVPKKKKQLQLAVILIHKQTADPPHQENKFSDVAFIMKLKIFPYERTTSCMYLISIYHVIVTRYLSRYLARLIKPPHLAYLTLEKKK